jgi:16S rRNA (cytosine967-C5)-methyltransferase
MNSLPAAQPRPLALEICQQLLMRGQSLDDLLEKNLPRLPSERDRAFCSELCYGFCRYYFLLQKVLEKRLKKPLKARDLDVQIILLLGLYQIRFMRVENHAAVNESVKLLQKRKKAWAKGLVNALLRGYIRDLSASQSETLADEEQVQTYPTWMSQTIEHDWPAHSHDIFLASNQRAPMTLRVDLSRISVDDYLAKLQAAGIAAQAHAVIDSAVLLQKPVAVETLPGFDEAMVSVQDASAQIAADLLDVQSGMRVLDACAAPGGKTLHLLQVATGLKLSALDKDAGRLQRVQENLQRGSRDAKLVAADAAEVDSWFDGEPFDRILLDAPCSASGIIRRHPDIRLLRKAGDIETLAQQQWRLLNALWPLLKPGGLLLYSTCSLFKQENEQQVQRFLQAQNKSMEVPLNSVQWGQKRPVGRQILPQTDMDGFYYALLKKLDED